MPIYHTLGVIPRKRHTVFRKPNGELYAEELVSTQGFAGTYSLVYHCHPPTLVKRMGDPYSPEPVIAREKHLRHFSLNGFSVRPQKDYLQSRKPILLNQDLQISLAAPKHSTTDYFYKNSQADELVFIHGRVKRPRIDIHEPALVRHVVRDNRRMVSRQKSPRIIGVSIAAVHGVRLFVA